MSSKPPEPAPQERFSSAWGLILASLGMAIGAGNIWRFPRVLAANGGGAFLIPWAIFLVTWSIPILMVEFGLGRKAQRGPVGSFAKAFGRGSTCLGAFVAFCTLGIMFYYSVLTGWCMRYVGHGVIEGFGGLASYESAKSYFVEGVQTGGVTVLFHAIAIGLAAFVVAFGVTRGIERACKFLIPALLALVLFAVLRALSLPGAVGGLEYIFHVDFELLTHHKTWLEALSQSAWSTGAGWGLLMCYAVYARRRQPAGPSCALTGFGNNMVSIAAAMMIIPAVFALLPTGYDATEVLRQSGPGLTGVSFVWIPVLYETIGGGWMSVVFFLALSFAALSSLIAMVELGVRTLIDLGLGRRAAAVLVGTAGFLLGVPSALSTEIFDNQDWVWGLGLIVNGGFFTWCVLRFGVRRFREEYLSSGNYRVGRWFDWMFRIVIPLEFLALMGWWFYQSLKWADWDIGAWLDPFDPDSVGTCLVQWGGILVLFALLGRWLSRRSEGRLDA